MMTVIIVLIVIGVVEIMVIIVIPIMVIYDSGPAGRRASAAASPRLGFNGEKTLDTSKTRGFSLR